MRPDQASSIVWLILGACVVYSAYRLGLGTLVRPGPGFLTFWASVLLCFLSILVFLQGRMKDARGRRIGQLWEGVKWSNAILIFLTLLAYALVFTYVGFLISTSVLLFFLFRAIDPLKWRTAIWGAVLASLLSFIVFDLWLQVQLPHWFPEVFLFKMKRILF
jgi:putative tricarboxylic transport membrane protein